MVEPLKRIMDSLEISPSGQIIFQGRPLLNFMEFGHRTEAANQTQLQKQLSVLLYEQFYKVSGLKDAGDINFLDDLRKNNLSRTRLRKGYRLEVVQEIPYIASKGSHRLKLHPGAYLLPGDEIIGGEAWIRIPKDRIKDSFYFAFSQEPALFFRESILRFYFNTGIKGSVMLMNFLTGNLNRMKVPFVLKCVYESNHIQRSDNFVLYTDYRFAEPVYTLIKEIPETINRFFYPATPLFTLVLQPGISFAENPHDPLKSFGMARCELLAAAITETFTTPGDRLENVFTYIEGKGYHGERFFLNPQSKFAYSFLK